MAGKIDNCFQHTAGGEILFHDQILVFLVKIDDSAVGRQKENATEIIF